MAEFRKKPVVIEAVQLRWDTWNEMCDHAGVGKLTDGKPEGCYFDPDDPDLTPRKNNDYPGDKALLGLLIPTLEGLMKGVQGDWIIRGIQGELYPCKPDIFAATYEPVSATGASGAPQSPARPAPAEPPREEVGRAQWEAGERDEALEAHFRSPASAEPPERPETP